MNNFLAKECSCTICVYHREFELALEHVPKEHKKFFMTMYELLVDAESERDYCKALVEGTWGNCSESDEIIKHRRKRLKESATITL